MGFFTIVILAFGLSMDAFAVSVSNGICYAHEKKRRMVLMAASFGLFQGIMPIIGFAVGQTFTVFIERFDHWLAMILLALLGGKMIYEAIKEIHSPEEKGVCKPFTLQTIFVQSLATSIDALAVGIGFAAVKVAIVPAACIIAIVTFSCCVIGSHFGKKVGGFLKGKAEIAGGLILILIGLKIFFDHVL